MMGLGSIVGTGIFVSIGIAAGVAGPAVLLAIAAAAPVAVCNGLSSARLAASHPVSGGTYEYGYRYLSPSLGFAAGWMFLCAKTASAATAALGFAGYLFHALGQSSATGRVMLALVTIVVLTLLVLRGIRWSSATNIAIVSVTLLSLTVFVVTGLGTAIDNSARHLAPFFSPPSADDAHPLAALLEACALMFVAYTGYGRIATLGEEIRDPERNIPRAVVLTLVASMLLYCGVAWVAIAAVGSRSLAAAATAQAAPLEAAAEAFGSPGVPLLVAIGAATAMLGVLLNLILGLSRVALAMGRRGDLPSILARLDRAETTPYAAVLLVGVAIAVLAATLTVKITWSFSAFTVLIYYALTNLAALRLPARGVLFTRVLPWAGLVACLALAFWVEPVAWLAGLAVLTAGFAVRLVTRLLLGRGHPCAARESSPPDH
jgi:APA family basic amino acid/polyamine antiporter